jgi:uncharacterized SAM-binding protein YcdF (DUF218 family)
MPRAMRLAAQAGLEVIPVPCDYRAPLQERSLLDVIPSAEPLEHWESILREHLAAWVGR